MKQRDFVVQVIANGREQGLEGEALTNFAVEQVKQGLMSGECHHSKGCLDEKAAKSYAPGVVGNYMKKAKEINGGVTYVPTFRRGPIVKDERLKDLKSALKSLELNNAAPELISQVKTAIEVRQAEVDAEKAQSKAPSIEETMAKLAELGITA